MPGELVFRFWVLRMVLMLTSEAKLWKPKLEGFFLFKREKKRILWIKRQSPKRAKHEIHPATKTGKRTELVLGFLWREPDYFRCPDAQKWFKELGSFKVWKTYRATTAKDKYTAHHLLKNNNEETKRELKTYRGQEQNPQDTWGEGSPEVIAIEHTG